MHSLAMTLHFFCLIKTKFQLWVTKKWQDLKIVAEIKWNCIHYHPHTSAASISCLFSSIDKNKEGEWLLKSRYHKVGKNNNHLAIPDCLLKTIFCNQCIVVRNLILIGHQLSANATDLSKKRRLKQKLKFKDWLWFPWTMNRWIYGKKKIIELTFE